MLDQFNNLVLEDAHDDEREAEAAAEDEEDEEYEDASDGQHSEHYDEDEEEDDVEAGMKDGRINSQLAVGAKVDRSFVVRGDKIGVFKHTPHNHLEFSTAINNVETTKGKGFAPKKAMLHAGDKDMVLQTEGHPKSLYRMDLEVGKVVDEWRSTTTFRSTSTRLRTSSRSYRRADILGSDRKPSTASIRV